MKMNSFELFKNYVDYVVKSNKFDAMVITGRAGTGKSFLVSNKCPEATISTGHLTSTKLFELLKNNCKKGNILVFDDANALLNNKISNALLKSAICPSYDGKRIVQYDSRAIRDMEDRFVNFEGKIIIILNDMVRNRDVEAILSKSFHFDFMPSDEEIMEQILKTKNPNVKVLKFLSKNIKGKNVFNFRTYFKAVDIFNLFPKNWEEMVKPLINGMTKEDIIDKLINSGKSVQEQVQDYIKATGKTERTYYREKKKKKKK